MLVKSRFLVIAAMSFTAFMPGSSHAEENQPSAPFETHARQFFKSNCTSCHGEKKQKGDVTLHDLKMDFASAEEGRRWMTVLGQLENGEMPPEEKEQPSHAEREGMIAGIMNQFRLAGNPIELLRSAPKYGNYVNHRELFSGEHKGPSFSRPRIWRISPYIDGRSSPFSLSQEEGFKDYAHMWSMDKPTIELLLVKANAAVKSQIGPSEAELKIQDEIWKKQTLTKRRSLQNDIKAQEKRIAKDPENDGAQEKLENLTKQLEKNEATDFEKDRRPAFQQAGSLQKNVYWRIAYGDGDASASRPGRRGHAPVENSLATRTFCRGHRENVRAPQGEHCFLWQ